MKGFLVVIIITLPFSAFSIESQRVDSLNAQLGKNPLDTTRIKLLTELALEYAVLDTTKAFELLNEAKIISENQSSASGLGYYHQAKGKIWYHHGNFENAIEEFRMAQSQFLLSGRNNERANTMVDEGNAHLFLSAYDIALAKYNSALDIFNKLNNRQGKVRCHNNIGIIRKNFGQYKEALESYNEVINLYEEAGDITSLTDTYINIGVVHVHQGNYHTALDFFNRALMLAEQSGEKEQQAISLLNSGVIHNKINNFSKAFDYYKRSLAISRELKDKVEISKCLTNIGTNYISQGKYELAEDYINQGLELKKELGDLSSIANCYNFLAEIHYAKQNYPMAIDLDLQAISIERKVNDTEGLARCFGNLGLTYLAMGKYQESFTNADSSLAYAIPIGALEHIVTALYVKMKVFESKGDYEKAYTLSLDHKRFSDSLMNENKLMAVNEIEFKYQTQLLEKENNNLKIQSDLDAEIIKRQKKVNIAVIVAIFLSAIVLLLFVLYQRKRNHFYTSIQRKNLIITKQNLRLDSLNNTKDKLLSVITHDLRGTIGNQLTALSVLSNQEFKDEDERKLVFSRLANSATMSLDLLENLTLWTKIQDDQIVFLPEQGYLKNIVEEVVEIFKDSLSNKDLNLELKLGNISPLNFDQFMIKTVIKNLISNAIKFSNRGSKLYINVYEEGPHVEFSIKDEGIGLSDGEISYLKKGKISKINRGTENEKGSGLGIYIVKKFLDYHNTQLDIESTPGKGTIATFNLKLEI